MTYIEKNNFYKSLENVLKFSWFDNNSKEIFIDLFKNFDENLDFNEFIEELQKRINNKELKEKVENYIFVWSIFSAFRWFFLENILLQKFIKDYDELRKNDIFLNLARENLLKKYNEKNNYLS